MERGVRADSVRITRYTRRRPAHILPWCRSPLGLKIVRLGVLRSYTNWVTVVEPGVGFALLCTAKLHIMSA